VVNEVSDSVQRGVAVEAVVTDTLYVQDEPADVVFGKQGLRQRRAQKSVGGFDQTNHCSWRPFRCGTDPRGCRERGRGKGLCGAGALGNHTTQIPAGIASNQPPPTNPSLPAPPKSARSWMRAIHYGRA